nr:hypothetical protein CFP56_00270 [Quercus suber]
MQSTRLFAPAAGMLRGRAPMALRVQPKRMFQSTPKKMMPVPKEEHAAHTISQRIRQLKKIPPELIPLGVVLAAAIGAAVYSLGRKLYVDKTLRLVRQGKQKEH